MLNNIVDNIKQCGQQNIVQCCFHQPRTGRALLAVYLKRHTQLKIIGCSKLLQTGRNNVVGETLFLVVNNTDSQQRWWAWISPLSGVTMLNNDNVEQCCLYKIVSSCFQWLIVCCRAVNLNDNNIYNNDIIWSLWCILGLQLFFRMGLTKY